MSRAAEVEMFSEPITACEPVRAGGAAGLSPCGALPGFAPQGMGGR